MTHRWKPAAAALLVSFALLAPIAARAQDGMLKIVPHADLRVLDPHLSGALITKMHGALVYETLLTWDSKLNIRPMAAEALPDSPDRTNYRFTLRPGMVFHDGQPVRSQDVVASLRRWMLKDSSGARLAQQLAGIDVESDRVFTLKLKAPSGLVEFSLGAVGAVLPQIMREKDADTDPNIAVAETIGSGPFRFMRAEWVPGAKIVYARNAAYVPRSEPPDGLAGARIVKVDRLQWTIIPDSATAAAALVAGEVDFWDTVPLDLLPVLAKSKDVTVGKLLPLASVGNIRMNQLAAPFDNVKIRRVIARLVDQQEFMQAAVGNPAYYSTCLAWFVCGSSNETLVGSEAYAKPDLAEARRMLAESGYKGEPVVLLGTGELAPISGMTQVLHQRMQQVGFNVDLKMMAWGAMTTIINKYPFDPGSWNIFVTYSTGGSLHHPLTNVYADTNCASRTVAGWPCDETATALKTTYLAATEPAAQRAALEALHRRLWEVIPYVPTGQFDSPFAWRSNLSGVAPTPLPVFWNIARTAAAK